MEKISGAIANEISTFVHAIDGLQISMPIQTLTSTALVKLCDQNCREYVQTHGKKITENGVDKTVIGLEFILEWARRNSQLRKAQSSLTIIPQIFISALVSQYDSFLGGLVRCIYRAKPEFLNNSKRRLTFSALTTFKDLDEAREYVLEKVVETLLRKSHHRQFDLLAKRFTVELKKDLPIWPVFIEVTQRRNLFSHCNGVVSSQYLQVCDAHGVNYDGGRPEKGAVLGVTPEYFERAHDCLFEIGTKLAHVLWRKLFPAPDDRKAADSSLSMLIYDIIVSGRYKLAITMGEFATKVLKTHSSEETKRMMVVNLAQSYKWNGELDKAKQTVNGFDWSSQNDIFRLALAVLNDDFDSAATLMELIGSNGKVKPTDYRDWPLFREFRKTPRFLSTYVKIFGQEFVPLGATQVDSVLNQTVAVHLATVSSISAKEKT